MTVTKFWKLIGRLTATNPKIHTSILEAHSIVDIPQQTWLHKQLHTGYFYSYVIVLKHILHSPIKISALLEFAGKQTSWLTRQSYTMVWYHVVEVWMSNSPHGPHFTALFGKNVSPLWNGVLLLEGGQGERQVVSHLLIPVTLLWCPWHCGYYPANLDQNSPFLSHVTFGHSIILPQEKN